MDNYEIDFNDEKLTFNSDKMKKLIKGDKYLQLTFKDMCKQNMTEDHVLQVMYNTFIVDDICYRDTYSQLY
jgi:hypothetical protein